MTLERPRLSLLTLPDHVLDAICTHTDTTSLVAMTTTCRILSMRAEEALYKDIDLRVVHGPGQSPQKALQRLSEQTRGRLEILLAALQNQPRRITYVRAFTITVWDGIAHLVAKIVEAVATCVKELDVDRLIDDDEWNVAMRQTLSSMSSSMCRFDKLKRLEVGCSRHVLAGLLGMAPVVEDIIVVQCGNRHDAEQVPTWPAVQTAKWLCITNYELADIAGLIQKCPGLRYLQMWPETPAGLWPRRLRPTGTVVHREIDAAAAPEDARALRRVAQDSVPIAPAPPAVFAELVGGASAPVSRRMRSRGHLQHASGISSSPPRPSVKFIDRGGPDIGEIARDDRRRAGLEQVDMLIPGTGKPTPELGRIQRETTIVTLVHAAETLYVVRQMTTSRPVSYAPGMETDRRYIPWPRRSTPGVIPTWYESLPKPMLEFQAAFRGERVPVEILLLMAQTDGVEQWQGRDVQVGDQAWQVLLDWYAVNTDPSLV